MKEEDRFPIEATADAVIGTGIPKAESTAEEVGAKVSAEAIAECVVKMRELFADGFQPMDLLHGFGLCMEILEVVDTMTPEEKELAVINAAKDAAQGVEMDLIPWVPASWERKGLIWIIDTFGPSLVKWACSLTKGKYNINQ